MLFAPILLAFVSAIPAAENPLLVKQFPIPFDRIEAGQVAPAAATLLEQAQKRRDAFVASTGPRTYENTLAALEAITEDLSRGIGIARHLEAVRSTPALRAAVAGVLPKLSAFYSSLSLDSAVYAKVKEYAATPEAKALTGARKRHLELTLKQFRRGGAELNEEGKKRLRAMSVELTQLSKKFADNVLDSTNAFELVITDEARLAGLPERDRAAARESAKKKGVEGWRFTLQAPSLGPALMYLDDRGLREQLYRASAVIASSGAHDNRPIMKRILELRRERAKLLGYRTFADLMTEERMARSGENVRQFLATLERKTRPFAQKEHQELAAFRKSLEGPNAPPLAAWDITYYSEKLRKSRFDLDVETLRPYFPMQGVMQGMFEIVNRLYGIKVVKASAPVWNPAVDYYEVRDEDASLLGAFYADWFPREDKRAGGWSNALMTGGPTARGFEPHLGTINGNMTPPVGGKPALFSRRDAETVFHEFGHQLHTVLSRVPVRGLHGVAWDFVELPSQIMENFTWDRECLDLFARHYETGERIPEDLFQKMVRARNFRAAAAQMRQLSLATMDLALHTDYRGEEQDGDMVTYARKVLQRFTEYPIPEYSSTATAFSHIFAGGYASGYYSYKWAEVLDADAFTRFQKEGVLNPKTGMEFRRKILEKGNTAEAADLFRDFMGREPDPDALLRRSGLL